MRRSAQLRRWTAAAAAVVAAGTGAACTAAGPAPGSPAPPAVSATRTASAAQSLAFAASRSRTVLTGRVSGGLTAVACASRASCVVVGSRSDQGGDYALAERWNGRGWVPLSTPLRPGYDPQPELASVSCPRPSFCQAVGGAGAERWSGGAWVGERTATTYRGPQLSSVSCASTASCVAVGIRSGTGGGLRTFAEIWDGRSWAVRDPLNHAGTGYDELSSVSCASASDCIAVGYYQTRAYNRPLAEQWDGTTWRLLAAPAVAGRDTRLSAVSCASAISCLAVGRAGRAGFAESWNGGAWTRLPPPPGSPTAVSCPAGSYCVAVGGIDAPAAAAWDGSAWRPLRVPRLHGELTGVSCLSASSCMAAGTVAGAPPLAGEGNPIADPVQDGVADLAIRWNGHRWRTVLVDQAGALRGVACASAGQCLAAGGYVTGSIAAATLSASWNGSSWQRQTTPADAPGSLASVSCASATRCVAVGAGGEPGAPGLALSELWDGSTWKAAAMASLPFPGSESAVSCAGANCLAVGDGLVTELWDGAAWKVEQAQRPQGFYGGDLTGVSCASTAFCLATGWYQGEESNPLPLAETWHGASWTVVPAPGIGGSTVSCPNASFCLVAGGPDVAIWNAGTWRTSALAGSFAAQARITAVSCASASACMVVGYYPVKNRNIVVAAYNLAEFWDGSGWRIVGVPDPGGGGLISVSCASATRCMAVGVGAAGQVGTRTLAEAWTGGASFHLVATPNP